MSTPILPGDNADLFPDELPAGGFEFDHSPGAVAQRVRLLEALRSGPVNTLQATEKLGIMRPAARVSELNALGYVIRTARTNARDAAGVWHKGIACYVLMSEPEQPAVVAA